MDTVTEKQSVKSLGNVLVWLLALTDLVLCVGIGFFHKTPLGVGFLVLTAAGITISAIGYYDAAKEGLSKPAQNAIGRLFMTIGFALLAAGYLLKG